MMTELIEYRVIGTIKSGGKYYCDCRHCNGHDNSVVEDVEYVIEAENEESAKQQAETQYTESGHYAFGEWITVMVLAPGEKPPRPREVELEMLKRWNEGLGLLVTPEPIKEAIVQ